MTNTLGNQKHYPIMKDQSLFFNPRHEPCNLRNHPLVLDLAEYLSIVCKGVEVSKGNIMW